MAGDQDDAPVPGPASASSVEPSSRSEFGELSPAVKPAPATARGAARRLWRRWPLALLAFALALILGFAVNAELARRRRAEAIAALQKVGRVELGSAPRQRWPWSLFARPYEGDQPVSVVRLVDGSATDAALVHVAEIGEMEELSLAGSDVTDAGLAQVCGVRKVAMLDLSGTGVTDSGIEQVANLASPKTSECPRACIRMWYCPTANVGT